MTRKHLLISIVIGVMTPIALLLVIVGVSDRPLLSPTCPDGVSRDGVTISPQCIGGFLSVGFVLVLAVVGAVAAIIAWRHSHGRVSGRGAHDGDGA